MTAFDTNLTLPLESEEEADEANALVRQMDAPRDLRLISRGKRGSLDLRRLPPYTYSSNFEKDSWVYVIDQGVNLDHPVCILADCYGWN